MTNSPVELPKSVLRRIMDVTDRCGGYRNECIVYVTADVKRPSRAIGVIHPDHVSTSVSTTVGLEELSRVWDELSRTSRKIALQVHTHPGAAFHSHTDDHFPVIHSVGFPSLVLAWFGGGGLEGAHLAVYQGDGKWEEVSPERWTEQLLVTDD